MTSPLVSLPFDRMSLFIGLLSRFGLTAELAEECLKNKESAAELIASRLNTPPSGRVQVPPPEPMWRPVEGNPMAVEVNLAAAPKRPFVGAQVDWRWGQQTGWVRLELKDGDLYRDGKKVDLYFDSAQVGGSLQGYALCKNLERTMAGVVLHPNEKTALMANEQLFPESWKVDDQGRDLFIFFWAVGFRRGSTRYAVFVFFDGDAWCESRIPLGRHLNVNNPAAHAG